MVDPASWSLNKQKTRLNQQNEDASTDYCKQKTLKIYKKGKLFAKTPFLCFNCNMWTAK